MTADDLDIYRDAAEVMEAHHYPNASRVIRTLVDEVTRLRRRCRRLRRRCDLLYRAEARRLTRAARGPGPEGRFVDDEGRA